MWWLWHFVSLLMMRPFTCFPCWVDASFFLSFLSIHCSKPECVDIRQLPLLFQSIGDTMFAGAYVGVWAVWHRWTTEARRELPGSQKKPMCVWCHCATGDEEPLGRVQQPRHWDDCHQGRAVGTRFWDTTTRCSSNLITPYERRPDNKSQCP